MEVILPFDTQDREHFCECATDIGFDEFVALKFIYTMQDSDLDIFQLMNHERLSLLLYGWEVSYMFEEQLAEKPPHLRAKWEKVLKRLCYHSLDIWFSKEWDKCPAQLKAMLYCCIKRAKDALLKIEDIRAFNWDYALKLGLTPRCVPYLQQFEEALPDGNKTLRESSEQAETPATEKDIEFLKEEGPVLALLRLIKMFDAGYKEGVKRMSMRLITAWNTLFKQGGDNNAEDKRVIMLICHIYLMAIYEMDDVVGYAIDNMVNNIRFYYQGLQDKTSKDDVEVDHSEYTPARYIALTCNNLGVSSKEFFEYFIFDTYDECMVSLFGMVSQSYMSYLLGNLLMEMNNMNEENFTKNLMHYKRLINLYIMERERSEMFMLREQRKKDQRLHSHSLTKVMENMTDFKSKMCKGNRMSNISGYENSDEAVEEDDRRIDPVFQNIPNYEDALCYVYNVLAQRTYKGWHFAKLVLLLKIIDHEVNAIETWRYHPGLTTDFMLNLENNLSHYFEDLAKIFQEYPFLEQEFWLTAFYLNPCKKYYEKTMRCGMRNMRQRFNAEGQPIPSKAETENRRVVPTNAVNAKYGLLSSTIDVVEIVKMTNHEAPEADYTPLEDALRSLRLSEGVIKDLLTVTFLPRNKSFAWAVPWPELRKRCKNLWKNPDHKRRLVELTMAEANDRLKFLEIDYEKYKHRPQLDYGSIEEGYEGINNYSTMEDDSDDDELGDDSEDFEADSDTETRSKNGGKKDDHSEFFDSYFMSTRRTRARAAAVIATALHKEKNDNQSQTEEQKQKEPVAAPAVPMTKRDLKAWLQECTKYNNDTVGFKPFADIWNFGTKDLQQVENNCMAHLETASLLTKFAQLQSTKETRISMEGQQIDKNDIDESDSDQSLSSTAAVKDIDEANDSLQNTENVSPSPLAIIVKEEPIVEEEPGQYAADAMQLDTHAPAVINEHTSNNEFTESTKTNTPIVINAANQSVTRNISTDSTISISMDNDSNCDSTTINEQDSITKVLIKECMEKQLQVALTPLTVSELSNLRQPVVYVKRYNIEQYFAERVKRQRVETKNSDDTSSKSSNGSIYNEARPKKQHNLRHVLLKRHTYSSESSTDSGQYRRKRRGPRSRFRGSYAGSSSSTSSGRGRPKSMTVTPRSASGLKMRISSASRRGSHNPAYASSSSNSGRIKKPQPIIDFIQISSSSSSDSFEADSMDNYMRAIDEEPENDPLYEEEIIPI